MKNVNGSKAEKKITNQLTCSALMDIVCAADDFDLLHETLIRYSEVEEDNRALAWLEASLKFNIQ